MEGNNEKFLLYVKSFVIVITYLFIGVFLLLLVGISKVDAASSIKGYNTNGEDLLECYDCYSLTSNRNYTDFNYNFDYQQSTNLNIQFNNTIIVRRSSGTLNIGSPSIIIANGYQTYDIGSYCNQVLGTRTDDSGSVYDTITFNYAYSCDIPNYGGNFSNYRSLKVTYTRTMTGLIVGQTNYDNGFQVIETAYNPTPQTPDYTGTINSVGGNIINNNNQNTESIINNNNQNTQDIIDNQNANSQAQIDKIDESFNTCETFTSTNDMGTDNKYLYENGNYYNNNSWATSNYIKVTKGKIYLLTIGNVAQSPSYCLYGSDKSLITCQKYGGNQSFNIDMPVDGYIRYSWEKNNTTTLTGEYCYNRLDKQEETQQAQYDYMTDSTPADYRLIEGIQATDDTPISSLITFPIRLIQAFLQNINGTCADINFGQLFGTNLVFRCSDIRSIPNRLGNAYNIIDTIFCFFMIYNIFQLFVTGYNHITTLKDDFHEIYETRTYTDRSEL